MTKLYACGTGAADNVYRRSTSTQGEKGVWSSGCGHGISEEGSECGDMDVWLGGCGHGVIVGHSVGDEHSEGGGVVMASVRRGMGLWGVAGGRGHIVK